MKSLALAIPAAGASRRFGDGDKLLAEWNGSPLLEQTLFRFTNATVDKRILVVRPDAASVSKLGCKHGFEVFENHNADHGLASSIALAARKSSDCDGLMIALGDMPLVQEATIHAVISVWREAPPQAIVAPEYEGRRGHPVIFSKTHYPSLMTLTGDRGAGGVITDNNSDFIGVTVDDSGIAIDFDERADFMTHKRS